MRKFIKITILTIVLSFPVMLFAQNPPHPNGGNAPSGDENRVGHGPSGAPIGSGTIILMALGAAYAGRKMTLGTKAEE